jgi:hypothetical protein
MGLGRNKLTTPGADTVGGSQSARRLSRWGNVGDLRQAPFGTTTPPWVGAPMASPKDDIAVGGEPPASRNDALEYATQPSDSRSGDNGPGVAERVVSRTGNRRPWRQRIHPLDSRHPTQR